MKSMLLPLFYFLFCHSLMQAQAPFTYYGANVPNDEARDLLYLNGGQYLTVGKIRSRASVHVFNCQGVLQDSVLFKFQGASSSVFYHITALANGQLLAVGEATFPNITGERVVIAKFDAQLQDLGMAVWTPPGLQIARARAVVEDPSGRVFAVGETPGPSIDFSNVFWQEIDPSSLLPIGQSVQFTDGVDYVLSARTMADGNFLLCGYSTWGNLFNPATPVINRSYVMKITASGQLLWKRTRDETIKNKWGVSYFRQAIVDDVSGDIMVAGRSFTGDTVQNQFDVYIELLDANGVYNSSITLPMAGNQHVFDFVRVNPAAGFMGLAVGDSARVGLSTRYPATFTVSNINGPALVDAATFPAFGGHSIRAACVNEADQLSIAGQFDQQVMNGTRKHMFFSSGEKFQLSLQKDGDMLVANTSNTDETYTYEWLLNGQLIAGANTSTQSLSGEGLYTVVVQGPNGCTQSQNYLHEMVLNPGQPLFFLHYTTLCQETSLAPIAVVNDAATYAWDFGDGQSATTRNPNHLYASEGEYSIQLCVTTQPGQFYVDTLEILDHESANFFESLFEGDPDVYFILKNSAGVEVYRSQILYNVDDPFSIPCALLLKNEPYLLELWDHDVLDNDDDLGKVFLVNPTTGGTFTFGGLTLRFKTVAAAPTYCYAQTITITNPYITYDEASNTLSAHPGGSGIYHWYLNGIEISGETGSTISPVLPGSYTVEVISGFCNQISAPYILGSVAVFEPIKQAIPFSLFPNPSAGQSQLQLWRELNAHVYNIQIFDAKGQLVFQQEVENQFTNLIEFNWPEAENGMYQVVIPGLGAQKWVIVR